MKKSIRIIVVCLVIIMIIGVCSVAYADYYSYSGSFKYGYNTRNFTRINDSNVRCVNTSLSGISWVQHNFTRNGATVTGYNASGNLQQYLTAGDYVQRTGLSTPAASEKWNSRFDNTVSAGTTVSNAGHWHIWGSTGYWDHI